LKSTVSADTIKGEPMAAKEASYAEYGSHGEFALFFFRPCKKEKKAKGAKKVHVLTELSLVYPYREKYREFDWQSISH
jgi:hypothetical protein